MEFLPFLPFIAVSTPESLVLYYTGTAILGYKPQIYRLIIVAFLTSVVSYFVRSMPLLFGAHTLIELIMMVMVFRFALRLPILLSVVATFLAAFILGLAESIFLPLLGWVFGLSLKEIISDPLYRFLFSMPHLIVLTVLIYFVTRKGWYLRFLREALPGKRKKI